MQTTKSPQAGERTQIEAFPFTSLDALIEAGATQAEIEQMVNDEQAKDLIKPEEPDYVIASGSIIKNGDTTKYMGYEFTVSEVDEGTTINSYGHRVWYFTGTLTKDPYNDSIRNTGYNGARYSWRQGENLTSI